MGNRNRRLVAALGIATLSTALAACSNGSSGGAIASVDGQQISRDTYMQRLEASNEGKSLFNQLVQQALIENYAKTHNIDVSDADVDKKLKEIQANYPPGQFEAAIKQQGLTLDDVRKLLHGQLVLQKAVAPQVHVSDADVAAVFAHDHKQFDTPPQVKAKHILVSDLGLAQQIEAKLRSGQSFDALAKQYSIDPGSKDKGGELGSFGPGQMVPAFEKAAFTAPIGKPTEPVKSPFGYHIILVESRQPAQKATLANSTDKIRKQLEGQATAQAVPAFLAQLQRSAKIDIYDDHLKAALPPVPPSADTPSGSTAATPAATTSPAATPASTPSPAAT